MSQSVLIIGAGVFGVTAATELKIRGYEVTLTDPSPIPNPEAASFDINKFVRMDYGHDEFYTSLMEEAFPIWHSWNGRWEKPVYHETGGLFMVHESMEPGGFEYESFSRLKKRGLNLTRLNPDLVSEYLPGVKYGRYKDGYFNPKCGWVDAGLLLAYLTEDAKNSGVQLRPGTRIAQLKERGSIAPLSITESGEEFEADFVIVSAGAWSPDIVHELEGLMKTTGQAVFYLKPGADIKFQPSERQAAWLADISKTGWYGFPALPDGTVKISNHGPGKKMHASEPRLITSEDEARFRHFLRENMPVLEHCEIIRSRLCCYTDSWDANFYIDRVPGRPNLIAACGGSGHGFKFAPVLGSLIADCLEKKPNRYLDRFSWRDKGKNTHEQERSEFIK